MEWMSGWASQQARELGHHWFGGEHLLLALSREPSIARDVLGELGVTHARLRAALVGLEGAAQEQPPHGGTVSSVSFHDLAGCAVGLAAGLGADQVRPEHVLLAVAWRPDRLAAHLLRSPAALADKGVAVPAVPAPSPPREVAWGPPVDVPIAQLGELTHRLVAERLPPGTPLGFNHDGKDRAWVVAEQGVDLAAEVRAVLVEFADPPGQD